MQDETPTHVAEVERNQRALVAWQQLVVQGTSELRLVLPDISESWQRSLAAAVDPALPQAPLVFDAESLLEARERDWVRLAEALLAPHLETIRESGHVLTLFDERGRMLSSAGDPRTLERLCDIHFTPGALWSEDAVGTNGPGTALALRRPVHVIGAEHFCEAWHDWHCAAVPLFSANGQRLLGALDISGHQARVTPYAFGMARALGQMVQQALAISAQRQRQILLEHFAEFLARYPDSSIVLLDVNGERVASQPSSISDSELALWRRDPTLGVVSVSDAGATIGTCLVRSAVLRRRPEPHAQRARTPGPVARYRLADLSGDHEKLVDARRLVEVASRNLLPVLLLGESGVGKEVAAQAIHSESVRAAQPFVAVNCGAIAAELVESELFGYVPGAFSGAHRQGALGKFAVARGGTLFLDEISELPLPAQAALLRVLAENQYTPVGGNTPQLADVRVIAASNRDLPAEVAAGRFRADLYYRLNVIAIALPPLRARGADIPELCQRFLAQAARETGREVELGPEVMSAFLRYRWPGNVRELENLIRRLSATSRTAVVTLEELPTELREPAAAASATHEAGVVDDPHKHKLMSVIAAARTMAEAAAMLGVTRSTLYRQLERFGLRPGRGVRAADEPE